MIYFIQGEETRKIKIGFSVQPEIRLQQLQTGSPDILSLIGVAIGGEKGELVLHERFNKFRSHGEWFHECDEILSFVESCTHDSYFELAGDISESEKTGNLVSELESVDKNKVRAMYMKHIERLSIDVG